MPARKAKKAKPKKAKKATKKRPAGKAVRKIAAAKPRKPAGPEYSCILCGVEVAVTKSGLGISRLLCCGQPMSRK
jgi:desulfoferrodoxin-like iron-binding protein